MWKLFDQVVTGKQHTINLNLFDPLRAPIPTPRRANIETRLQHFVFGFDVCDHLEPDLDSGDAMQQAPAPESESRSGQSLAPPPELATCFDREQSPAPDALMRFAEVSSPCHATTSVLGDRWLWRGKWLLVW